MKRSYRTAITAAVALSLMAGAGVAIAAVPSGSSGTPAASAAFESIGTSGLSDQERRDLQQLLRQLSHRSVSLFGHLTAAQQLAARNAQMASQSVASTGGTEPAPTWTAGSGGSDDQDESTGGSTAGGGNHNGGAEHESSADPTHQGDDSSEPSDDSSGDQVEPGDVAGD